MAAPALRLHQGAIALAGVLLAGCASIGRGTSRATELRVVSWNIQAGGKGIDSIAAMIHSLDPDIVGLQEVDVHWSDRSRFIDEAQELARRLRMSVIFAPIYSLPPSDSGKPPREFGVAVLTRYRIVRWRNDSLTRLSTQVANATPSLMTGLLDATLDVGGREVRFLTTHLDYRADPGVRRQQVAEMLKAIGPLQLPTIVVGDMNAAPDAPEIAPLLRTLHDAWRGSADDGLTYPADQPVKRIDYVLASSQFTILDATVPAVTASDHRPVLARLRLP